MLPQMLQSENHFFPYNDNCVANTDITAIAELCLHADVIYLFFPIFDYFIHSGKSVLFLVTFITLKFYGGNM